jgi:hypothetical protein
VLTTGRNIMNRRNIFTLSAITALGLALLPGSAVAQQGTLKQQLVGTWTLVSDETTAPSGTKQQMAPIRKVSLSSMPAGDTPTCSGNPIGPN